MIQLFDQPTVLDGTQILSGNEAKARGMNLDAARANTLARRILAAHNKGAATEATLRLRFDALAPMWASSRPPGPAASRNFPCPTP